MVDFRLYLVTNRTLCTPTPLVTIVQRACAAGVRCVQLREKDLDEKTLSELHSNLYAACHQTGAKLMLNAGTSNPGNNQICDGFHFPESSAIPNKLGNANANLTIGASTHSLASAKSKADAGVDFITFGPVFDTPAKRKFGPPQGIERLAVVCAGVNIPVIAIGGITPDNTRDCIDAGAHGIAVMGAIMGSPDVASTVHHFESILGEL